MSEEIVNNVEPAPQTATDDHVLILGAGFSRALSDAMPLTDELGNLCLNVDNQRHHYRVPDQGFSGGSFETWLSRLADEQPYLRTEENLENQALFLRFSAAIADVLGKRVHAVLDAGWPAWLPELLKIAHKHKSTLITFNYDPLIECGVATGLLDDLGRQEPVFWAEVLGDVPNWPPGSMRWAATRADTFRLLKLHGSLNWYWSPGDTTGVSVARRVLPGVYGNPEMYTESERRRELPGRVPFVVPPAATKSPYYQNSMVREIWGQAHASLQRAKRVTIIGYSLPAGDLTVAGLLADSLLESPASISVVDVNPEPIIERLESLGLHRSRLKASGSRSGQPVADFVAEWLDEVGSELVHDLTTLDKSFNHPLLINWGRDAFALVTEIEVSNDGEIVELVANNPGEIGNAVRYCDNIKLTPAYDLPILHDLVTYTKVCRRLSIRTMDGSRQTPIEISPAETNARFGLGDWNVLIPSGPVAP